MPGSPANDQTYGPTVNNPFLWVLILVAFALRFSGVFWGLPGQYSIAYHPDEPKIVNGAFHFPEDIRKRSDFRYPTACHYLLGALSWPAKITLQKQKKPSYLFVYQFGRLISVLMGTACVLLVFVLARDRDGWVCGMIAAAVMTFSSIHITTSAWATTDTATSFWLIAFLLAANRAITRHSTWLALLAGVTLGMLVGSKYTGALGVVPFTIWIVADAWRRSHGKPGPFVKALLFNKVFWIVALISIGIFLATTPGVILRWNSFLGSIRSEQARMSQRQLSLLHLIVWENWYCRLGAAVGKPLTLTIIAGLMVSCAGRRRDLGLVALVIGFLFYFRNAVLLRYYVMLTPVLAIFAARAILTVYESRRLSLKILGYCAGAAIIVHAMVYSIDAAAARYPETRTQAGRYIHDNLPRNTRLGIAYNSRKFKWRAHPWKYPKLDFKKQLKYVDFLENPEYVLVSSYDKSPILRELKSGKLEDGYKVAGDRVRYWYKSSPPSPAIFRFYQNLYLEDASRYELVRAFTPRPHFAAMEQTMPRIELYRRVH